MNNMLVIIRIRGLVNVRKEVADTLNMLKLDRKHHCVLLNPNPSINGMLKRAKDYITYGEISDEVLELLIKKRARKIRNLRLNEKEAEEIILKIKSGEKIKNLEIKPVFRLTPPSKGFRHSIKQHFPRGELGYRGEKINELLKRMI